MRESGDCDLAVTGNSVPATPALKSVFYIKLITGVRRRNYWRMSQIAGPHPVTKWIAIPKF